MHPWLPKGVVLAALLALSLIRAPHVRRSLAIKVVKTRETTLDRALVCGVLISLLLTIAWAATPLLSFADYTIHPAAFATGIACFVGGLWLLHRTHTDLGANWSNTLELREDHRLVTGGVYRSIRHPMYSALLLYSVGQALALPNWVAGPASLLAFGTLVAIRLGSEEQMMQEQFGQQYATYAARTKRLVPGVW